jgi:hypothetical protein
MLLVLGSLLVGVCLMELAFSTFRLVRLGKLGRADMIADRTTVLREKHGPLNQEDPRRGWENSLVLHPLFGYVFNPELSAANNYGFNTEHDFELTEEGYQLKGVERDKSVVVGIFGGSFASQTEESAGEYLEDQLEPLFPGRKVYVVNFAHGGHALPQSAFIFTYFRSMLDVAIFVDGLNELWNYLDNNQAGCPPEYAKAAHYLYKTSVNELDANRFEQTVRILDRRNQLARLTRYSLLPGVRQSALVHYVWERLARRIETEIARRNAAIERSFYESTRPFTEIDPQRLLSICARQYGRYHAAVHQLCHASGIVDIHTLQPNPYVADSKAAYSDAEREQQKADQTSVPFVVKNGYPYLRQELLTLTGQGVIGKDLSYIYQDQTDDIWTDNCHANERGYRIVADHLLALIGASRAAVRQTEQATLQRPDAPLKRRTSSEPLDGVQPPLPALPAAPHSASISSVISEERADAIAAPSEAALHTPSDEVVAIHTRAVRGESIAGQPGNSVVIDVSVRFQSADADEVLFVWGLENWSVLPAKRPPGTSVVSDTVMHTPMTRAGDAFVVQLQTPDPARLDFGFLITRTRSGEAVRIWRDDGGKNFSRTLSTENADEVIDRAANLPSGWFWLLSLVLSSVFAGGTGVFLRRSFQRRVAQPLAKLPPSEPLRP